MQEPIFISGLRKSGTSLVKSLLDGHPDLFVYPPNELHFFRYSAHEASLKDKKDYINEPNELLQTLANSRYVEFLDDPADIYRESVDVPAFQSLTEEYTPGSYAEVYEAMYEAMFDTSSHLDGTFDNFRPTSKTVLETEFYPYLRKWFPETKFVYILRNPYGHLVSARNSMLETEGGLQKREGLSETIKDPYPRIASELWRMKLSYYFMRKYRDLYPDNFYVLVFDELLAKPEAELRDLASFLNIEYDSALTNPTICGELWGGNSWDSTKEFEGISTDPIDHWKNDIRPLEVRAVNDLFDDILEEYDFEQNASRTSLLRPFHISERPLTYIANRVLYLWQRHGNIGGKPSSLSIRSLF